MNYNRWKHRLHRWMYKYDAEVAMTAVVIGAAAAGYIVYKVLLDG